LNVKLIFIQEMKDFFKRRGRRAPVESREKESRSTNEDGENGATANHPTSSTVVTADVKSIKGGKQCIWWLLQWGIFLTTAVFIVVIGLVPLINSP
jgi:hypothetical protein